jgi:DNA-directed RNA polymerase specialized sigma24 family protein
MASSDGITASPELTSPLALPPLSPIERIAAHRERLFVCAVQLLDEPRAAQQVVAETIDKALLGVKDGRDAAAAELERSLDRLLVSLALVRLKAMPPPVSMGRGGKSASADGMASLHDPFAAAERERESEIPDGEAAAEAQFARTAQVLASLPIEARIAVTLVVMQGRSLADAAFLLATTEESCRFFLNHGRKLMRRALQRDLLTSDGEGRAAALLEKFTSGTTTLHDLRRSKKATIRA